MSLHEEPQKDGFTHETPIRAFTTFSVDGMYALGKGFRPSLQHLMPYLNAMEKKEGWRLVQILEATTQTPSFVFRQDRPPMYSVTLPAAEEISPEFKKRVDDFLSQCPPLAVHRVRDPIMPELREMDNRSEEQKAQDDADEIRNGSYRLSGVEAMREIDKAREKAAAREPSPPIARETGTVTVEMNDIDPANLAKMWTGKAHKPGCASLPAGEGECNCGGNPNYKQAPERIVRASPALSAPYTAPKDWTAIQNGDIYENMAAAVAKDDPVNPKHYGGTACAEIGELLTANSYQVLKYNWRLGEKDDEKVELGKALWYLDRELTLHATVAMPPRHLPEYGWFDERLRHATPHAQAVARILISWNRYGNYHSLRGLRKNLKRTLAELEAKTDTGLLGLGRGMEP